MANSLQLAVLVSLKSTQRSASTSKFRGRMGLAGMANFPCRLAGSIKSSMSAQFAAASNFIEAKWYILITQYGVLLHVYIYIYIECCRLADFLLVPVFANMAMQDSVNGIQY